MSGAVGGGRGGGVGCGNEGVVSPPRGMCLSVYLSVRGGGREGGGGGGKGGGGGGGGSHTGHTQHTGCKLDAVFFF